MLSTLTKPQTRLTSDGEHKVYIAAIKQTEVKPCIRFKDTTPQIVFLFKGIDAAGTLEYKLSLVDYKTADQYTTEECNLKQFKFDFDGTKYEIDSNGYRVVCDVKTEEIGNLIGHIANQCGFKEGDDISLKDLLGKQLTIRVKDKQITHTLSYDNRH